LSDIWRVEGDPKVVVQEIQFTNGDAHLTGTVYLPESGDHLPAVVALHGASEPTREAAVYRHLREGLPAMGVAVLVYDRRGTGASSGSLISCSWPHGCVCKTRSDFGIGFIEFSEWPIRIAQESPNQTLEPTAGGCDD
jgi:cephalosporin-C deacetylase-like acetyl esterase